MCKYKGGVKKRGNKYIYLGVEEGDDGDGYDAMDQEAGPFMVGHGRVTDQPYSQVDLGVEEGYDEAG
jgi:hypothetical protein